MRNATLETISYDTRILTLNLFLTHKVVDIHIDTIIVSSQI